MFTISKVNSLYQKNSYKRFQPAMFGNIFEIVQLAFAANDLESLRLCTKLEKKIDVSRTSSVDKLLSAINNTSLTRNFGAESYILKHRDKKDKAFTAIR